MLATSREPLGLPGEVICPVQPLDLPPETAEAREAGQAAAVRLFLDRGSAARGGTADGVAVAVAERICRKLDGLPLAIELAAARLGTLSAAEIEARLADRFRFLAYRRPVADPRHQALRAAMDWSYELLSAERAPGPGRAVGVRRHVRPAAGGRGVRRRGPGATHGR